MKFANYPPLNMPTVVAELWDGYLPVWRKHAEEEEKRGPQPVSDDSELLDKLKAKKNAPRYTGPGVISSDEAKYVTISRRIRSRKGKWRTVPKEVEEDAQKDKS
jgi:hypothetical protein